MASRRLPGRGPISLGDAYTFSINNNFQGGPDSNISITAYRRASSGTPVQDVPPNQRIQDNPTGTYAFTDYYRGWQGDDTPPDYEPPDGIARPNIVQGSPDKLNPTPNKNIGEYFPMGPVGYSAGGIPTIAFTGGSYTYGGLTFTVNNETPNAVAGTTSITFLVTGSNSYSPSNRDDVIINVNGQDPIIQNNYFYRNEINTHLFATISTTSAGTDTLVTISGVMNVRTSKPDGSIVLAKVTIGNVVQETISVTKNGATQSGAYLFDIVFKVNSLTSTRPQRVTVSDPEASSDSDYLTSPGTDTPVLFSRNLQGPTAPPRINWVGEGSEILVFTISADWQTDPNTSTKFTYNRPSTEEYEEEIDFTLEAGFNLAPNTILFNLSIVLGFNWGSPTIGIIDTDMQGNHFLRFNTLRQANTESTFNYATNQDAIYLIGAEQADSTSPYQFQIWKSFTDNLFDFYPVPTGLVPAPNASYQPYKCFGIYPSLEVNTTFYLLNQYIVSGSGTALDPYVLVMYKQVYNDLGAWTNYISDFNPLPTSPRGNYVASSYKFSDFTAYSRIYTNALDVNNIMQFDRSSNTFAVSIYDTISQLSYVAISTDAINWVFRQLPAPQQTGEAGLGPIHFWDGRIYVDTWNDNELFNNPLPYYYYSNDLGLSWNIQQFNQSQYSFSYIPGWPGQQVPDGTLGDSWEWSAEGGVLSYIDSDLIVHPTAAVHMSVPVPTRPGSYNTIMSGVPVVFFIDKDTQSVIGSSNQIPSAFAVNNPSLNWFANLPGEEFQFPICATPQSYLSNAQITYCGSSSGFTLIYTPVHGFELYAYNSVPGVLHSNTVSEWMIQIEGSLLVSVQANSNIVYYSNNGVNWTASTSRYNSRGAMSTNAGIVGLYQAGNSEQLAGTFTMTFASGGQDTKPRFEYFNTNINARADMWPSYGYLYKGVLTVTTTATGFTTERSQLIDNANGPDTEPIAFREIL